MDNKSSKIKTLDLYYYVNLTSKFFNTEYHCKTILNSNIHVNIETWPRTNSISQKLFKKRLHI